MVVLGSLNGLFFEKFQEKISGKILFRCIVSLFQSQISTILFRFIIPNTLSVCRVSKYLFVLPMTVSMFVLVVEVLAIIEKIALPLRDTLLTYKLTQLDPGFFLQLYYHSRRGALLLLR